MDELTDKNAGGGEEEEGGEVVQEEEESVEESVQVAICYKNKKNKTKKQIAT